VGGVAELTSSILELWLERTPMLTEAEFDVQKARVLLG
jgi:hypothetical protein